MSLKEAKRKYLLVRRLFNQTTLDPPDDACWWFYRELLYKYFYIMDDLELLYKYFYIMDDLNRKPQADRP